MLFRSLKISVATTLTGRVTHNGNPVADVRIKLSKAPPAKPGETSVQLRLLAETVTDKDGRYKVGGLHKGERYGVEISEHQKLTVRDWHYHFPWGNDINSEDGATIELPDAKLTSNGQSLSGVVVDPDGNPVAGIHVSAKLASGGHLNRRENSPAPWTDTDSSGRFELTDLPDEPIGLMAYNRNTVTPGGSINYYSETSPKMGATDIRITVDPRLGSDIEDLDAK